MGILFAIRIYEKLLKRGVNNLEKFHQKAHLILVAKISPMYNLELIRSPRRQAQDLFLCFIFYFLVNNIIRREF